MVKLRRLGADDALLEELTAAANEGTVVGRVGRVDRGRFQLLTADDSLSVSTSGVSQVCVGDWCVVTASADGAELVSVLPRRTALARQSSGPRVERQALAANIDTILVVVPLDRPILRRQIERFLALAWDSGALPVIVLTKRDLVDESTTAAAVEEVRTVSGDTAVLTISVVTGDGMEQVAALVEAGRTVALLGTSGSGKSSLVNALVGSEAVLIGAVRAADAKGRHTTTWRELVVVPTGGTLIDTPGLRELGMWIDEEGIDAAFADITDLAEGCRFSDCAHDTEPKCAVRAAIAAGELDPERLVSYNKLLEEAAFAANQNDIRLVRAEQKLGRQRVAEGRKKPKA
jgi:ribosome biogenesis GTPase